MITNKTRAERGLAPYVSPKKDWDERTHVVPEVLVAMEPSSRAARRAQDMGRRVQAHKNQARATRAQFARAQREYNQIGVARVYLNLDGAHERSPHVARNVTARVYREADAVWSRDRIPWTGALKKVEGQLMNVATSAGLR
jgi:hypothetical protein